MRSRAALGALFVLFSLFLFSSLWPSYQARRQAETTDKTVSLALDFEDLLAAADGSSPALNVLLTTVKDLGVSVLALSGQASLADEKAVRAAAFSVLWQVQTSDFVELRRVLGRFGKGDGCMSTDKDAPGFPMYMNQVARVIRAQNVFLPVFEFFPQKGFATLSAKTDGALIKAHLIGDRESLKAQTGLWEKRLLRAARERGVRFFYLRLSPARNWQQNVVFLNDLVSSLNEEGFSVGAPRPHQGWKTPGSISSSRRVKAAVLLAIVGPLIGVFLFGWNSALPIYVRFLLMSAVSTWAGVVAYLLGSVPAYVVGIAAPGGIKAQLLTPLLIAGLFLIRPQKWQEWAQQSIKIKHVFLLGGVMGGLLLFYLMRSGNFPLIPVTDSERHLRDGLESLLGARPRFKEFFIGHPALMAALVLQMENREWRPWFLAGLIGQVSILNTFLHFHIPLELGLLRTFHGFWIGSLVAWPLCWGLNRFYARPR